MSYLVKPQEVFFEPVENIVFVEVGENTLVQVGA